MTKAKVVVIIIENHSVTRHAVKTGIDFLSGFLFGDGINPGILTTEM